MSVTCFLNPAPTVSMACPCAKLYVLCIVRFSSELAFRTNNDSTCSVKYRFPLLDLDDGHLLFKIVMKFQGYDAGPHAREV